MNLFKISITNWFKIIVLSSLIVLLIIFGYFAFVKKSVTAADLIPDQLISRQDAVKLIKNIIETNMNRLIGDNQKKEEYRIKSGRIPPLTEEVQAKSYALEYKTFNITLFFSDANAENLVGETREIKVESDDIISLTRGILMELIKGPAKEGNYPVITDKTRLWAIYFNNGCIYLDFHKNINDNLHMGSTGELLLLYSITNTLTQFQEIQKVRFLIDGTEKKSFETRHNRIDEDITKNEFINRLR